MVTCPYCSGRVLRHFHNSHLYWFCRRCWREVPLLEPSYKGVISISCTSMKQFEPSFELHAYFKKRLIDDEIVTDTFR